MLLASPAPAAQQHKLKTSEARSAAELEALDYQVDHQLDDSDVGRCQRKAARRVLCLATAKGETSAAIRTCSLRISVRDVYRTYYWDTVAAIVKQRCSDEDKPYLDYADALAAIQAEANRFAGQPTTVTYMFRRDDVTFSGRAEWERTRVPPNKFLPTENCSIELVATLSSSIAVTTDGFACY